MGDTSIHTNTKKIWKDVATSQSTEIKNNAPKTCKNLCHLHMSVTRSQSAGFGLKSTYSESIAASKPDWKALAEWQGMFCSSLLWTLWRSTYKIIQNHTNLTSGMRIMKFLWIERSPTIRSVWTKTEVHPPKYVGSFMLDSEAPADLTLCRPTSQLPSTIKQGLDRFDDAGLYDL